MTEKHDEVIKSESEQNPLSNGPEIPANWLESLVRWIMDFVRFLT